MKNNNFNQNYFKNNQNEKQVKSMALDNIQAGKTINHKKYYLNRTGIQNCNLNDSSGSIKWFFS